MMNYTRNYLWLSLFFSINWHCLCNDSLPNHISVKHYLEIHREMITAVRSHFDHERLRLHSLEKKLETWKSWRESYSGKESEYIAIPQNLFHLFKNMTLDLDNLEKAMMENSHSDTMAQVEIEAPTTRHLESIIMSLIDVQYLYDLKPINILRGELIGRQINSYISVENCKFVWETCFKYNEHKCVVDWINACIPYYSDSEQLKKMYKLIYTSYLFLNNTEQAYEFVKKYHDIDPLDVPSNDVKIQLGHQLSKPDYLDPTIVESHKICRGTYKQFMSARNFTCRYNYENSAFLRIAPLKEEQLYDYPKILLYHDAIYNSEINQMKAIATDKLTTSTVYSREGDKRLAGFVYRISQTAFIDNMQSDMTLLRRRIQDMSDLSLKFSEWWQVVNYSPGGFYRVHSDYLPAGGDYVKTSGNRMATLLFYLNDVPLGGETVFPNLKLSVTPEKGSVLMWHNILPDGSENSLTYHSACPVIIGEKWGIKNSFTCLPTMFTQWIREKEQKCLRHIYEKYVK